jgi:hypothetical protein
MDRVEKLLYSRRDAAEALSLSIRSIDYLITTRRLITRRVGGKILIPVGAVRRFAREDHPEFVRAPRESAALPLKKPPISVPPQERDDVLKRWPKYRNER